MCPTNRDLPGPSPLPPDEDEVALLRRVASKDRYAFDLLYRSYNRRLTRFLEQTTRTPQLIDEILDDTMLVVWRKDLCDCLPQGVEGARARTPLGADLGRRR